MVYQVTLLLLLASSIASTHSFLSPKPRASWRKTKVSAMTPPAAEGSVDAQAREIIAELEAGTMTM